VEVHFVEWYDEVFKIAFPKEKLHHEKPARVARKKTR
jgi:hypothetical protein